MAAPGQPLPPPAALTFMGSSTSSPQDELYVYSVIAAAELHAQQAILNSQSPAEEREVKKSLMYARILGQIFINPPGPHGRRHVVQEVMSFRSIDNHLPLQCIYDFGRRYFEYLVTPFSHTPLSGHYLSRHPSLQVFNILFDQIWLKLSAGHPSHASFSENLKWRVLQWDGYRCMITRQINIRAFTKSGFQGFPEQLYNPVDIVTTHCCHIFPQSLDNLRNSEKKYYACAFWTIVEIMGNYGTSGLFTCDVGPGYHVPRNLLTLSPLVHDLFDSYKLWFEEIHDQANTYIIRVGCPGLHGLSIPNQVTFRSQKPDEPLPDPLFLRIHATISRIANRSGVGN